MASSVEDLVRWQDALVKQRLLKPESYERMITPGKLNDGESIKYALGLNVTKFEGAPVIRHGGGINGFRSSLAYFPESKLTVAVLANMGSAEPGKLSDQVSRFVLKQEANSQDEGEPAMR